MEGWEVTGRQRECTLIRLSPGGREEGEGGSKGWFTTMLARL